MERQKKIKEDADKNIAELESILDSVQKAESVKESICRRYPFATALTESNFRKFAGLRPNLKQKCANFINDNSVNDVDAINELWTTPLKQSKKQQANWLKLAAQSDIDLYVNAPLEIQNAIEETAKHVVLESQQDVDEFWNRTGLRQQNARRLMEEQRVQNYNRQLNENKEFRENNPMGYELGYSFDIVRMTEEMMKD